MKKRDAQAQIVNHVCDTLASYSVGHMRHAAMALGIQGAEQLEKVLLLKKLREALGGKGPSMGAGSQLMPVQQPSISSMAAQQMSTLSVDASAAAEAGAASSNGRPAGIAAVDAPADGEKDSEEVETEEDDDLTDEESDDEDWSGYTVAQLNKQIVDTKTTLAVAENEYKIGPVIAVLKAYNQVLKGVKVTQPSVPSVALPLPLP